MIVHFYFYFYIFFLRLRQISRKILSFFRQMLTKIQTYLQDGKLLFFLRLNFFSQNVSEFLSKVSEFVWKLLPQNGKKSFWVNTEFCIKWKKTLFSMQVFQIGTLENLDFFTMLANTIFFNPHVVL